MQDSLDPVNIPAYLLPLSSWLVFLAVGLSIGLLSGLVSMVTVWLANIKTGRCVDKIWQTSKIMCDSWTKWTEWKLLNYSIYVLLSVRLHSFGYQTTHTHNF